MKTLTKFKLLIARWSFNCPVCGKKVYKGDNYVDDEGIALCVHCGLPHEH
jgi:hypothetical protein